MLLDARDWHRPQRTVTIALLGVFANECNPDQANMMLTLLAPRLPDMKALELCHVWQQLVSPWLCWPLILNMCSFPSPALPDVRLAMPRFGRQFVAGDSTPAGYFSDDSDGGLSWSESPRRSAAPTPGDGVRDGACSCLACLTGPEPVKAARMKMSHFLRAHKTCACHYGTNILFNTLPRLPTSTIAAPMLDRLSQHILSSLPTRSFPKRKLEFHDCVPPA